MAQFEGYALWYDLLYGDKNYGAEAAFVDQRLRAHGAAGGDLLDLGAGTGAHALELARLGWRVTGVDVSEAMVRLAQGRASSDPVGAAVRFEVGDVRSLQIGAGYDVVTSLFHVASYQTNEHDLALMLGSARRALSTGGLLLFDYWYAPAVRSQGLELRVKTVETDAHRITRIAKPGREGCLSVVDYTMFCEDRATGLIQRIDEVHRLRGWLPAEVDQALAATGFAPIGHFAWMEDAAPTEASWAAYTLARAV